MPEVEFDSAEYRMVAKKGEGTFSEVVKAQSIVTGEYYAVKCMKTPFKSLDQVNSLREIQALRRLNPHANIIDLEEVLYDGATGRLALVFELMDQNVYEMIRGRKQPLKTQLVKLIMYQLLKAVAHMHKHGIFHRDIKPENVLVVGDTHLKVADFGSCRGIYTQAPYTEYISTRWYRSPEALLTNGYYDFKMDIWGIGAVMFEIIALFPLFPGANELDQVEKIHAIMGTPAPHILDRLKAHSSHIKNFNFPPRVGSGIAKLIPHAPKEAVDLIERMLEYDAEKRITARQALRHPYFKELRDAEKRERVRTASPKLARSLQSREMRAAAEAEQRASGANSSASEVSPAAATSKDKKKSSIRLGQADGASLSTHPKKFPSILPTQPHPSALPPSNHHHSQAGSLQPTPPGTLTLPSAFDHHSHKLYHSSPSSSSSASALPPAHGGAPGLSMPHIGGAGGKPFTTTTDSLPSPVLSPTPVRAHRLAKKGSSKKRLSQEDNLSEDGSLYYSGTATPSEEATGSGGASRDEERAILKQKEKQKEMSLLKNVAGAAGASTSSSSHAAYQLNQQAALKKQMQLAQQHLYKTNSQQKAAGSSAYPQYTVQQQQSLQALAGSPHSKSKQKSTAMLNSLLPSLQHAKGGASSFDQPSPPMRAGLTPHPPPSLQAVSSPSHSHHPHPPPPPALPADDYDDYDPSDTAPLHTDIYLASNPAQAAAAASHAMHKRNRMKKKKMAAQAGAQLAAQQGPPTLALGVTGLSQGAAEGGTGLIQGNTSPAPQRGSYPGKSAKRLKEIGKTTAAL